MQTTDANGRVDFDTCFPGWYSSRTMLAWKTLVIRSSTSDSLCSIQGASGMMGAPGGGGPPPGGGFGMMPPPGFDGGPPGGFRPGT